MSDVQGHGSEVARLLERIRLEQESAMHGLHSFAETAKHEVITQKMMNIGSCQERLVELLGEAAIPLIIEQMDGATMPLIVDQSTCISVVNSTSVQ